MKIAKLYKWLPVILPLLGAAGYHSENKWMKVGVDFVRQTVNSTVANQVSDVLPDLSDWVKSSSSQNANSSTAHSSAKRKNSYSGRVGKISDGDTLRVTDSDGQMHKIRMAFIDAPESQQIYGAKSRATLQKMAENERVKVVVVDVDRYGREVAQVFQGNKDLNLAQVQLGSAWHYTSYAQKQSRQDFNAYAQAEQAARKDRKGLWQTKNPQAPWDYRKQKRIEKSNDSSSNNNKWFGLW